MSTQEGLPVFTELLYVQLTYARLQRQLLALKTFLPGPLLVSTYDQDPSGAELEPGGLDPSVATGGIAPSDSNWDGSFSSPGFPEEVRPTALGLNVWLCEVPATAHRHGRRVCHQ